ncbi:MAG: hypothetical protein IT538_12525 [Variibacter sp.]|nr:hypothetical protein [Variibacter sp.]
MRTLIASALAGLALLLIPANAVNAATAPAESAKVQVVDQKVSHKAGSQAGSDMQDCYCRRTYRVRYYRVRYVPVRYYRVRYSVRYWVVYR